MNRENIFKVIGKDGKEIVFEILFTFESDETNKNYMVYTDNSKDENGNVRISASIVKDSKNPNSELEEIKTDREWKIIDTVLKSTMNSIKKHMEENNNKGE